MTYRMSRYTADGKRRSSMAHARHPHLFSCGKVAYGNGSTMHRRAHGCREMTTSAWIAAGGTVGFLGITSPSVLGTAEQESRGE